ncbi:hypothetical protein AB0H83_26895 [Dactylosporangium sp. NPDC050688]|uniref:hypothetical protein n=1 Tax=Dactylosporangium sp. NPDC050688 TaxID=3157217 RepID=UPI0033FAFC83
MDATQRDDLDGLRAAAGTGDPAAMRALGHRLCVLSGAVYLDTPDDEPEAERWLRRSLAAAPADPVTATLLAGLLLRQQRTALELSPLYDGLGAPGTGRAAWLRALWRRRAEALDWFRRALAADPVHAAAANGLALALLDPPHTEDFVYYPAGDEPEPEGLDDEDPAALAEAEAHLQRVLTAGPGDAVTTAVLARVTAARSDR